VTIKIIGTGVGQPTRVVSNDELATITGLETSDEWIRTRTGIETRRLCTDETLTDLSVKAAQQALADAKLDATKMDYLIAATIGGDKRTPSLACMVAEQLTMECPAVDLNGGCVGFVYALDYAEALIAAGRAKNVLIVCAEKMSAHMDFTDRSTCVLFGDGAAAVVVTQGKGLEYIRLGSVPDSHAISMPNRMMGNNPLAVGKETEPILTMDGQKVFKFAVKAIQEEVTLALNSLHLSPDDIDLYLLHQANGRIIDSAIQHLGLNPDKFPRIIQKYGNMSSVSIPTLLHEMLQQGEIEPGQRLLLCAFGAGLTYGTCVISWE